MDKLASPLEIRPHHLLCLLGFHGLGYSDEFVANMRKVRNKLTTNSTLPIVLVVGADAICASCPHNSEGRCLKRADSEAKVRTMDSEVLRILGFQAQAEMPVAEAWEKIRDRFTPENMADVCHDCEWWHLGHCVEGLVTLHLA